jgi:hypothetical protein
MKTKVLAITVLLLGGLMFSSCQKDNSLIVDNVQEQSFTANNIADRDIDPEVFPYYELRLTNYPEPFYRCTTIEYELPSPALVELKVCCESDYSQYADAVLVSGMQRRGIHTIEFNSCNLPVGEFIVYLTVDNRRMTRTITKIGEVDTEIDNLLEQ